MEENARIDWDCRYSEGSHHSLTPDPFLVSAYEQFVAPNVKYVGRALDIAGGVGRHALYLAERGWLVTLMDISEVALQRARRLAEEREVHIFTEQIDLSEAQLPVSAYDLVVVFSIWNVLCYPRLQLRSGRADSLSTRPTRGSSSSWAAVRHIPCTCWSPTNCGMHSPVCRSCTIEKPSRTRRSRN